MMTTETQPGDISRLLIRWSQGENEALEHLIPKIYSELRQLAAGYLRRERSDHTLQPTELVNETFLRLTEQKAVSWQNRQHFFGIAAQMMRRILVDHARQHLAQKRGAGAEILSLDEALTLSAEQAPMLLALDEALDRLAITSPEQAKIVELRFFGGMTGDEIASLLGISRRTVARQWRLARARLYTSMTGQPDAG